MPALRAATGLATALRAGLVPAFGLAAFEAAALPAGALLAAAFRAGDLRAAGGLAGAFAWVVVLADVLRVDRGAVAPAGLTVDFSILRNSRLNASVMTSEIRVRLQFPQPGKTGSDDDQSITPPSARTLAGFAVSQHCLRRRALFYA